MPLLDIHATTPGSTGAQNNAGSSIADFELAGMETLVLVKNKKTGERFFLTPHALAEGRFEAHKMLLAIARYGRVCDESDLKMAIDEELKARLAAIEVNLAGKVVEVIAGATPAALAVVTAAEGAIQGAVEGAKNVDLSKLAEKVVETVVSGLAVIK